MDENSPPPWKRQRRSSDDEPPFIYRGQSESEISKQITQVAFDPSVSEIQDWAFNNNKLLRQITIPETIMSIGVEAFSGCEALTNIQLREGSLRIISRSAFLGCKALPEMNIPIGVEAIGAGAFEECDALETVSMPSSVETIGDDCFQDCFTLTSVSLNVGLQRIGRRAFCRCENLTEIKLPLGLKEVPFCAFSGCDSLKTALISNTVEILDASAFDSCRSLAEVELGQGLRTIGARAFARCISLSAITLPSTIETIAAHAFHGCLGLLGVEMPEGTTVSIAPKCFDGCISLINVNISKKIGAVHNAVFSECKLLWRLLEKYDMGQDEEGNIHGIASLQKRFDNFPVHLASYHCSRTTVDTLNAIVKSTSLDKDALEDMFGMTPLHIVATSAQLKGDLFQCLLNAYPLEVLWRQDRNNMTVTNYLLTHTSNKAVPLIQLALQRLIDGTMSHWGLSKWRIESLSRIRSMPPEIGTGTRNIHIKEVYKYLDYCMRIEVTSLMEQALWKMRMSLVPKAESENDQSYREGCRLQCGSCIVIENVMKHLWNDEAESDAAWSVYPLVGRSGNS